MMEAIIHCIRILYPLVQSFKFLKRKDQDGQIRVLKYWSINWMLSLTDWILEIIVNQLLVDIVLISLAVLLVYNHFLFASKIFDFTIQPLIQKYENQIEQFITFVENKVSALWGRTEIRHTVKQKIVETVIDQVKKGQ